LHTGVRSLAFTAFRRRRYSHYFALSCVLSPPKNTPARGQVAADHGLELVRKRGGQALFGVAPPTASEGAGRRDSSQHQQQKPEPRAREELWSPRASGVVLPPSPGSPPPDAAAAAAAAPVSPPSLAEAAVAAGSSGASPTPPSPSVSESRARSGAAAAAAAEAAGVESAGGGGSGGGGVGVGTLSPVTPSSSSRVSSAAGAAEKKRGAAVGGPAELRGWWGAGGAGWGSWSHVDMQLVVGQASKHRVSRKKRLRGSLCIPCVCVFLGRLWFVVCHVLFLCVALCAASGRLPVSRSTRGGGSTLVPTPSSNKCGLPSLSTSKLSLSHTLRPKPPNEALLCRQPTLLYRPKPQKRSPVVPAASPIVPPTSHQALAAWSNLNPLRESRKPEPNWPKPLCNPPFQK